MCCSSNICILSLLSTISLTVGCILFGITIKNFKWDIMAHYGDIIYIKDLNKKIDIEPFFDEGYIIYQLAETIDEINNGVYAVMNISIASEKVSNNGELYNSNFKDISNIPSLYIGMRSYNLSKKSTLIKIITSIVLIGLSIILQISIFIISICSCVHKCCCGNSYRRTFASA